MRPDHTITRRTVLKGLGSFVDAHTVKVSGAEELTVKAKHIIVATGSTPIELPFAKFDGERIISSTEALSLPEVPKRLVVIGGGVIGLELGSVYKRLGSEVTVVEFADSILATMDGSIGKEMQRVLRKTGMTFHLGTKVEGVERHGDVVKVKATDKKGNAVEFEADYCLVAVGRKANTAGLNYQAAGITADDRGRLDVNDHLQTSQPHIYAIGDVVRGAMLAHKAEEEGVVVAEQIACQKPHIDYNLVPGIVYTWPEAASVGQTEEQLKASGRGYKVGNFPMRALGRSRASGARSRRTPMGRMANRRYRPGWRGSRPRCCRESGGDEGPPSPHHGANSDAARSTPTTGFAWRISHR